ncbi:MAG: flagellar motor protein [Methylococcaceae bacterium]|nr:flagellar motor protein [Methylococcaceae bacterium]
MDILSVIGVLIGIGALLFGNFLEGANLSSLVNGPAFIIVFGGTIGATLLQFPPLIFIRSLKLALWVFFPKREDLSVQIDKIVAWSHLARKEGLLGLENEIEHEHNSFIRKGLQLLVDGNEPEDIREIMELEINNREDVDLQGAKMLEAMGGYAPTVGMLAAVMGLIHVMENLSDPKLLGAGIATAFVATVYGVGSANLFFLPMANKVKTYVYASSQVREMMAEGLIAISQGENPRNIKLKLSGYLHEQDIVSL